MNQTELWISFILPIVLAVIGGIITIYTDKKEKKSEEEHAVAKVHLAEATMEKAKFEALSLVIETLKSQIVTMKDSQEEIRQELVKQCNDAEAMAKEFKLKMKNQSEEFESDIAKLKEHYELELDKLRGEMARCYEELKDCKEE